MAKTKQEQLNDALVDAALEGALEVSDYLKHHRKDPDSNRRVQVALGAVTSYTRFRASQNNMISMMLIAARQGGVSNEQTLDMAKAAGLLPPTVEAGPIMTPLKAAR
jgi:hypothetical protein